MGHHAPALSLAIVGVAFPNKRGPTRRFAIELCVLGDPVKLVAEPKNPADPNAIQVFNSQGMLMGYVTAERAPWIGKLMQEHDVRAIFQSVTRFGAVIRVAFDGEMPELPQRTDEADQPSAEADPDYWPDFIPPND